MAPRRKEVKRTGGEGEESEGRGRSGGRRSQDKQPSKKTKLDVKVSKKNPRHSLLHGVEVDGEVPGSIGVTASLVDGGQPGTRRAEVDKSSHEKGGTGKGILGSVVVEVCSNVDIPAHDTPDPEDTAREDCTPIDLPISTGCGTGEGANVDAGQDVHDAGQDVEDGGQDLHDDTNPSGEYESSNLQRIHVLMNKLSAEELAAVLRTHKVEPEFEDRNGGRRSSSKSLETRKTAEKRKRPRHSVLRGDAMEDLHAGNSGAVGDSTGVPKEQNQQIIRTAEGRAKVGDDPLANAARVREEAEKKIQELRKIPEDAEAAMPPVYGGNGSPSTPRNFTTGKEGKRLTEKGKDVELLMCESEDRRKMKKKRDDQRKKSGRRRSDVSDTTGSIQCFGGSQDSGGGIDWPLPRGVVPPVELNRLGYPCGAYWAHMKPYVFDRGQYFFPWHISWARQSKVLKANFIQRLKTRYPGNWESRGVLKALGNSIKEKRARLKRRLQTSRRKGEIIVPEGCSDESFAQIQKDIEDPVKKRKAELCAMRASERKASGSSTFAHRCGRHGYDGIIREFEIAFDRTPNLSELQYARTHGLGELLLKTRSAREGGMFQPCDSENVSENGSEFQGSKMSDATSSSNGSSTDGSDSSEENEGSLRSESDMEQSM